MCKASQRDIEYLRAVGCSLNDIAERVGVTAQTILRYSQGAVENTLPIIERGIRHVVLEEVERVKKLTAEYEAFVEENK